MLARLATGKQAYRLIPHRSLIQGDEAVGVGWVLANGKRSIGLAVTSLTFARAHRPATGNGLGDACVREKQADWRQESASPSLIILACIKHTCCQTYSSKPVASCVCRCHKPDHGQVKAGRCLLHILVNHATASRKGRHVQNQETGLANLRMGQEHFWPAAMTPTP
jgi:hypothetical protein